MHDDRRMTNDDCVTKFCRDLLLLDQDFDQCSGTLDSCTYLAESASETELDFADAPVINGYFGDLSKLEKFIAPPYMYIKIFIYIYIYLYICHHTCI